MMLFSIFLCLLTSVIIIPAYFSTYLQNKVHGLFSTSRSKDSSNEISGKADAIIVLGYALHRDGIISEVLKERTRRGAELLNKDAAPLAVFSGAHPGGGLRRRSEASAMLTFAEESASEKEGSAGGVILASIQLEIESTSTRTNALRSFELLQRQGAPLRHVILVTSPFHQLRSELTFRQAAREKGIDGLKIQMACVSTVPHKGYGKAETSFRRRVNGQSGRDACTKGAVAQLSGNSYSLPLPLVIAVSTMLKIFDKAVDRAVDWADVLREVPALLYYKVRGYI